MMSTTSKSYTFLSGLHPNHGHLGLSLPWLYWHKLRAAWGSSSTSILMCAVCTYLLGFSWVIRESKLATQQATTPTLLAVILFFLGRYHVLLKLYVTVCSYSLSDTSVVMHSTGIKDDLLLIVLAN